MIKTVGQLVRDMRAAESPIKAHVMLSEYVGGRMVSSFKWGIVTGACLAAFIAGMMSGVSCLRGG